jgi:chemotaxis protein MotB
VKRRKYEDAKMPATPLWFVSFADMMMVLVCFFIAIVSFSTIEMNRYKEALGSFRGALSSPFASKSSKLPSAEALQALQAQLSAEEESIETAGQIQNLAQTSGLAGGIETTPTAEGVRITLSNPILFDEGKDDLKPAVTGFLVSLARIIKIHMPAGILIEGHTDDTPIHTDRFPSNWELSAARALKVLRVFQMEGIPAEKLAATGYGEFRPRQALPPSATVEEKAVNRRVEIILQTKPGQTISAPMPVKAP